MAAQSSSSSLAAPAATEADRSKIFLSMVCQHQVIISEDALTSFEQLTSVTNKEFFYLLRRPVASFVFTGISGHSRVLIETEDDLQMFLRNHHARQKRLAREDSSYEPTKPSVEVRLSPEETADVMDFLFQQLSNREQEVRTLRSKLEVEQSQLPPFVRAVQNVEDTRIPDLVRDIYGGSIEQALAALASANIDAQRQGARVLALWASDSADNEQAVWDHKSTTGTVVASGGTTGILQHAQSSFERCLKVLYDSADEEVVAHLLHLLARFATDPRVAVLQKLCGSGGPDVVVQKMAAFQQAPLVQQYGCWFFGLLSANEEVRGWLLNGNLKFMSAVMGAMGENEQELYVMRYGVSVLHSISETSASTVLGCSGCQGLKIALERFAKSDSYIASSAVKTLVNLSGGSFAAAGSSSSAAATAGAQQHLQAANAGLSSSLTAQATPEQRAEIIGVIKTCLPILTPGLHEVRTFRHVLHFFQLLARDSVSAQAEMAAELEQVLAAVRTALQLPFEDAEDHALALLANLSRNRALREELVRFGILEIFCVAVLGSRGREATHNILKTMAVFTGELALAPKLAETVPAVLSMMERYPADEKVQMNACYVLGTLAVDFMNKELIGRHGGITACLNALCTHQQRMGEWGGAGGMAGRADVEGGGAVATTAAGATKVLLQATAALAVLAETDLHKREIRERNGLAILMQVLPGGCFADSELAKQVCKLIALLVLDPDCQQACLRSGCSSDLMDLVLKHERAKDFLYYAFRCLANLLSGAELPPVRADFADGVLRAMETHAAEPRVQEGGCELLCTLSRSVEWERAFLSRDAVGFIVTAMRSHLRMPDVQRKACWALAGFAANEEIRGVILRSFGLEPILAALREYCGKDFQPEVCEQACAAISALSVSVEARSTVANTGTEVQVLDCVSLSSYPALQAQALSAVGNLAVDDRLRARLLEKNGVFRILDVLRFQTHEPRHCHLGCLALANLAHDPQGRLQLKQNNGVAVVAACLRKHTHHAGVAEQACAVFCNVGSNENDTKLIADNEGVEMVVGALRIHLRSGNPKAVESACFALTKFVALPAAAAYEMYARAMVRDGAVELLRQVNKSDDCTFDTRVCTNVLLRKLVGQKDRLDVLGGVGAGGGAGGDGAVADADDQALKSILAMEAKREQLMADKRKAARGGPNKDQFSGRPRPTS